MAFHMGVTTGCKVKAYFFSAICNERWAQIRFGDICGSACHCICGYTLAIPPPHTLPYYTGTINNVIERTREGFLFTMFPHQEPCGSREHQEHVIVSKSMMTLSYVRHDSFICVTRLIHMCDTTHSYVWHDSLICMTWLIDMYDMTHSYVWHDSFICVTWLIHTCDMTHSYVWHDSFIRVTWLIHMCDMTHSYVCDIEFVSRHDSFVLTWLIYTCDVANSYIDMTRLWVNVPWTVVLHGAFECVSWPCIRSYVTSHC